MNVKSHCIKEDTPLLKLESEFLIDKKIELWIKQDYLTHPYISGNKWRKLKYNIEEAKRLEKKRLLTFGGAYSNHIYAVAAAGKKFGFETIGVIRGEEHENLNDTLSFAKSCGMELHYMDRSTYRRKYEENITSELKDKFDDFYLIPEGGTNELALLGCQEMIEEIKINFDVVCMPCGTSGTLAGSVLALKNKQRAIGFSVLKGKDFLESEVIKLIGDEFNNWTINWDYHFGGYAKTKADLIKFIEDFKENYAVQLEPIYTGKMFYGLFDLIAKDFFDEGSKIVAIHTGGLQAFQS